MSVGLLRGAASAQAQRTLARQADGYAALLDRPARRAQAQRLAPLLRRQGLGLVTVTSDGAALGPDRAVLPADVASEVAAGRTVSTRVQEGSAARLVEGRPVEGGGGVVLLETANTAAPLTSSLRHRLALAALVGLVGAGSAGVLVGRRLARPLQAAAWTARRISAGHRDVDGPDPSTGSTGSARSVRSGGGSSETAAVTDALRDLAAALAHSEARQREFLLSVSHELRTPLTAVRGSAEAIADGVVEGDAARRSAEVVLAESQRLDRLVQDLLDLARLGADEFRVEALPVDLGLLVRDAQASWAPRCSTAGVELRVEVPADALVVTTDPGRVRQILDDLAENALRVTPTGAPLVFAVRREPATPGSPDSTTANTETAIDTAVVEVRDGGPGLTEDDLRVAFERSALHERYRGQRRVGTGLGLALVAGLAERLGGRAVAGHAPEGGAAFALRLPLPR